MSLNPGRSQLVGENTARDEKRLIWLQAKGRKQTDRLEKTELLCLKNARKCDRSKEKGAASSNYWDFCAVGEGTRRECLENHGLTK